MNASYLHEKILAIIVFCLGRFSYGLDRRKNLPILTPSQLHSCTATLEISEFDENFYTISGGSFLQTRKLKLPKRSVIYEYQRRLLIVCNLNLSDSSIVHRKYRDHDRCQTIFYRCAKNIWVSERVIDLPGLASIWNFCTRLFP